MPLQARDKNGKNMSVNAKRAMRAATHRPLLIGPHALLSAPAVSLAAFGYNPHKALLIVSILAHVSSAHRINIAKTADDISPVLPCKKSKKIPPPSHEAAHDKRETPLTQA
jgi:hypothetical protein